MFQVDGVDAHGKVILKKQLRRDQVAVFFANLTSWLIGMEAYGSLRFKRLRKQLVKVVKAGDNIS